MNAYPLPTSAALSNNLVTTPTRTQDWNQFDVRIDHTQSESEQLPRPLLLVEDRRPPTRTPSPPSSFPACRRRSASATRTPSPAPRGWSRSTPSSAGCTCSRRVWSWTRASATTASTSTSRRRTSSVGDAARRAARRAQRQPAGRAERHPDLQPRRLHGHRPQPLAADPAQGEHVPVRGQPDLRRRQAHHQGRLRRAPPAHGRVPDQPRQRPLQLLAQHHQQPGEQHRRPRHGLVPARRAEPDRAGLPAGRRGHSRHRIQRLRRRRLARDAEADLEPRAALRARHAVQRRGRTSGPASTRTRPRSWSPAATA